MDEQTRLDFANVIFGILVIVGLALAGNPFFQRVIEIVTGGTAWLFG